jgi:hypothetical protein
MGALPEYDVRQSLDRREPLRLQRRASPSSWVRDVPGEDDC